MARLALAPDAGVVVYAFVALGWVVLPILTFASDDLLDPSRLSLLPLSRVDLMTLLTVGALVGVAPVATLVAALGLAVGVASGPVQVAVAVAAALLEVAFCVVLSRVVVAALSGLLRSRRGRDIGIALTTLVALSFQLINPLLQRVIQPGGSGRDAAAAFAGPIRWTPPGLLASAPLLTQRGQAGTALLRLALVGGLVVAGAALWERLVARSLVRVDASGRSRERSTALLPRGIGRLLPTGRAGAVAAKDLRYLTRDPRRGISQLIGVLFPAFAVVLGPAYGSGSRPGPWAVFVVCLIAAFGGLQGANRFGLDGTSTWMLMASHTSRRSAREDLLGGDVATVAVMLPLLALAGLLTAALTDGWSYLPAAMGLAIALLLVTTAGSGIAAVQAPYAVPDNPRNAFSSGGTGQGCAAVLVTFGLLAVGLVVCAPLGSLLIPALHSSTWAWTLLAVGTLYGVVVGALLRRFAASLWLDRAPEVLQILSSTRS
ncbi:MAG: hypothetical protein LC789_15405 [Actinobacteria bacterium]|nr:hypothetical protein [Actinomycetota bacterium]